MQREEWSSKLGFLLAAVGSAVGLGNIWRFPYIVGISGGGSFVLIYILAVLLFGIPVMLIEFATGRKFKSSIYSAFKRITDKAKFLALLPIITGFFILSYYLIITGWTLAFFGFSISGNFLDFELFTQSYQPLIFFFISLFLISLVVIFGIKKGIENATKVLVPVLIIFLIILTVKSLTLPNAMAGIEFYLRPDFSKIFEPTIWILAFGQALFSLSAGYGILLTYGSYLSKKTDIGNSTFTIAGMDTMIALIAGFMIFPIVFSFGLQPAAGPELAFIALPKIFLTMEFGFIFGAIFFLLLFFAAISSAISSLEMIISNFVDELKMSRKKAIVIISTGIGMMGGIIALSFLGYFGMNLLGPFDFIFGSLLTPISAAVVCIVIGWFWKPKILIEELKTKVFPGFIGLIEYAENLIKYFMIIYLVRYVIPFVLILMTILIVLGFI